MLAEDTSFHRKSEFWGICCEGGKKYSQVVKQRFHITMAALDPTVVPTSPVVSLMVDRGGCEYLLCSLKPSIVLQVNLNLYFDKGEKVTFSLRGQGKIHLSGYHIYDVTDGKTENAQKAQNASLKKKPTLNKDVQKEAKAASDSEDSSEEDVNLNKNVQKGQNSPKKQPSLQKDNKLKQSPVTADKSEKEETNKQKKKNQKAPGKNNTKNPKNNDSDNSDEDDDDDMFDGLDDSVDEDDSDEVVEMSTDAKKDSKKLQSYKRLWSSLTQSDEEEEESESDSEEDDEDTSPKNKVSQDKKKLKKNETSTPVIGQKQAKNTAAKTPEANDKSALMRKTPKADNSLLNSSVGRTPMPSKKTPKQLNAVTPKKVTFTDSDDSSDPDDEVETVPNVSPSKKQQQNESSIPQSSEKKKKKKKKKNSLDAMNTSNASDGTPGEAKKIAASSASYSKKLPGGLEYEDLRIGNGPIAKSGRLVHVYYTGKLENNKVFDSREQGNKPFSFKLGSGNVIKGWDLGIEGMKVGGKRRMKIPASLGYKNQKMGPIPPNSTLYFTVELKSVT